MYKNAFSGKIKNVVGVDIKFIKPKNPDLIINNSSTKSDLYLNYNKILQEIKIRKIKIYWNILILKDKQILCQWIELMFLS